MWLPMSWLAACLIAQPVTDDGKRATLLRAVHDAFVANQASFAFGQVEFTYTRAKATGDAAARRGEFEPKYSAKGVYVFNGVSGRFEVVFPDEVMRSANTKIGTDIVTIIETARVATNGESTLWETVVVAEGSKTHGVRLEPGTRDFERKFIFPISLGRPSGPRADNAGLKLDEAIKLTGELRCRSIETDVEYEGRKVARIILESSENEYEYLFDLDRGALPLKIVDRRKAVGNDRSSQVVIHQDDVRQVPGRGWLPYKQTFWYSEDNRCSQIQIETAHFEKPPNQDAFAMELSEETTIVDEGKSLRYPSRRVWNILKLPSPRSSGVEKAEVASISDDQVPKMPGELPVRTDYTWIIVGLIAVGVGLALVLWRRRRIHVH